jgi:hypothetical protein
LNNSGNGYGAYNDGGTWTDFSGELNNSGNGGNCTGAYNGSYGTWTDFSGTLNNTGLYGAFNYSGTWTDFSGTCLDSGAGIAFSGSIGNITGFIGRPSSQPDLAAANIKTGKTILGVEGSLEPEIINADFTPEELAESVWKAQNRTITGTENI